MYVDRLKLEKLKQDVFIKKELSVGNADTVEEIEKIFPILENHVKESSVEKASNWMLFHDFWIQNETGVLKANTRYRNYTRGSVIISVDWGTSNIGTEIRYPHPGVVLFDKGEDWVIVAPITAAKIDSGTMQPTFNKQLEVLALKENKQPHDPNEFWFKKHSVIQLDQIQRISKYRILNKNSRRLKVNLLNQIDNLMLARFLPSKDTLIRSFKTLLDKKDDEIILAKAEIEKLTQENEMLKGTEVKLEMLEIK